MGTGLTRVSSPQQPAYSASKGAVTVLTQVWAAELGPRGITVNTLAPGAIDTDMNASWLREDEARQQVTEQAALRRVGYAEDIADAAAFLAEDLVARVMELTSDRGADVIYLESLPDAMRYMASNQAAGKIVVTV